MQLRYDVVAACLAAASLTACRGADSGVFPPATTQRTATSDFSNVLTASAPSRGRPGASRFRVVHSFGGGSDGFTPFAGLLNVMGTLYGTTRDGGAYGSTSNGGTAFSISTSGAENVLHSFGSGSDGKFPYAGLINVNGTLYGTTQDGGAYGSATTGGTIFSLSVSGGESILHNFGHGKDGAGASLGDLLDVNGTLYGTTNRGGAYAWGTVYRISTTGKNYQVLHSFGKGKDGKFPIAALIDVSGTLYGTTQIGGAYGSGSSSGGTVFSISTTGTRYKRLHDFGNGSDGSQPYASLLPLNGTLYGATEAGGTGTSCQGGCGTVYSISTTGTESVLYSFKGSPDGANPYASLIKVKGMLYGTTLNGGAYDVSNDGGNGTIFSITTIGNEVVLHSFGDPPGSKGADPFAALLNLNGTLYGTTLYGGAYSGSNSGTVFAWTP